MIAHVDTDTLLAELAHRHDQATMDRLAASCDPIRTPHASRLRWAVGSGLLRLGHVVLGEDLALPSSAVQEV